MPLARFSLVLGSSLSLFCHSSGALAQPPPLEAASPHEAVWSQRTVAVEMPVGFGVPTGAAGITVDYSVRPWAAISAGVGVSWFQADPQGSLMFRRRFLLDEAAFYIGMGASVGRYVPPLQGLFEGGFYTRRSWDPAIFANFEGGVEVRASFGLTFRGTAGLSRVLNAGAVKCTRISRGEVDGPTSSCSTGSTISLMFPYLGGAVGYAF